MDITKDEFMTKVREAMGEPDLWNLTDTAFTAMFAANKDITDTRVAYFVDYLANGWRFSKLVAIRPSCVGSIFGQDKDSLEGAKEAYRLACSLIG